MNGSCECPELPEFGARHRDCSSLTPQEQVTGMELGGMLRSYVTGPHSGRVLALSPSSNTRPKHAARPAGWEERGGQGSGARWWEAQSSGSAAAHAGREPSTLKSALCSRPPLVFLQSDGSRCVWCACLDIGAPFVPGASVRARAVVSAHAARPERGGAVRAGCCSLNKSSYQNETGHSKAPY